MDSNELPAFFHEIFDPSLPRLNPGDEASTLRALNMFRSAGSGSQRQTALGFRRILDLGCGCGGQTLALARYTKGAILALDNHQAYLDELRRRAEAAGLSGRIQTVLKDMRTLTTDDGPFDLIWSEGALFVVGFREGLTFCHSLLTPGGGLARISHSYSIDRGFGACKVAGQSGQAGADRKRPCYESGSGPVE